MPALAEAHGEEPTPEQIFQYVYAVLYAPSYRELYSEFLKTDFPRIPFTADGFASATWPRSASGSRCCTC